VAKVLVSLKDDLLRRIDRVARERGLSRSGYLADLAERDLARQSGTAQALARIERSLESSPADDSTAAIRAERDSR
jgi:metal-responsive CopG/Arc/MetJ family transcriptional regulator